MKATRCLPQIEEPLAKVHEPALREAYEEAVRIHESLDLPFSTYARGVLARLLESLRRSNLPEEAVGEALAGRATGDLYLALACEGGSPEAWRIFRERFGPQIRGRALRFLRREGAAGEMAADLMGEFSSPSRWEGVQTRIGEYNGRASLEGWLNTITANRCRDVLRREKRFPAVELEPDGSYGVDEEDRSPEDGLVSRDFRTALEAARARMSAKEAIALELTYFEELKLREIAPLLGVSISRTAKIVKAAVAKIREESAQAVPPGRWALLRKTAQAWLAETAGRRAGRDDRQAE